MSRLLVARLLATLAVLIVITKAFPNSISFEHGVACGAPSSQGSTISAVLTLPPDGAAGADSLRVEYHIATHHSFNDRSIVARGAATVRLEAGLPEYSRYAFASASVGGLSPDRRYFYRFRVLPNGPVSPVGVFQTQHADAHPDSLVVAHMGDAEGHQPSSSSWEAVRRSLQTDNTTSSSSSSSSSGRWVSFQVLHANDIHNHIEGFQPSGKACSEQDEAQGMCMGGMARVAALFKQQRSSGWPTLTIDAGDEVTGTVWDTVYTTHNVTAELQQEIGFDVFTLGNHEFDRGVDSLAAYLSDLAARGIPTLGGCNVDASAEPALDAVLKRWIVKEVAPGVKVGLLGYLTTETAELVSVGRVAFREVVPAMAQCVEDFRRAHPEVGVLIGVGHAGYLEDQQVAARVPGLDLIVGGHSHSFLWEDGRPDTAPEKVRNDTRSRDVPEGPYPTLVSGPGGRTVPVVQASCFSRYAGAFNVTFNSKGDLVVFSGSPVLLGSPNSDSPVPRDPAALAVIQRYEGPVRELAAQTIGFVDAPLVDTVDVVRVGESELGNAICDAMAWQLGRSMVLRRPVCLINAGMMRAGLHAGNITTGDVLEVLPFGTLTSVLNITGADLVKALETGVSGNFSEWAEARFPQVSGLAYTYSQTLPVGQRILNVSFIDPATGARTPLQPCTTYELITNDFVAAGGDTYSVLKGVPRILAMGPPVDEAFADYIQAHQPLPHGLYGRITNCVEAGAAAQQQAGCPAQREAQDTCKAVPRQRQAPPPQQVLVVRNGAAGGAAAGQGGQWTRVQRRRALSARRLLQD